MKTVKITTDNRVSIIDIPWTLAGLYEAIGDCDCFETVNMPFHLSANGRQMKMLVDESGRIKDKPINNVASLLYGILTHLQPIAGNVIFAEVDGEDLVPPAEPERLLRVLTEHFVLLEEEDTDGR